jgi:hypothetical protein
MGGGWWPLLTPGAPTVHAVGGWREGNKKIRWMEQQGTRPLTVRPVAGASLAMRPGVLPGRIAALVKSHRVSGLCSPGASSKLEVCDWRFMVHDLRRSSRRTRHTHTYCLSRVCVRSPGHTMIEKSLPPNKEQPMPMRRSELPGIVRERRPRFRRRYFIILD